MQPSPTNDPLQEEKRIALQHYEGDSSMSRHGSNEAFRVERRSHEPQPHEDRRQFRDQRQPIDCNFKETVGRNQSTAMEPPIVKTTPRAEPFVPRPSSPSISATSSVDGHDEPQAPMCSAERLLHDKVMLPIWESYYQYPPEFRDQFPQLLSSFRHGTAVYLTPSPALAREGVTVVEAMIQPVHKSDVSRIERWWMNDRALSYATEEWNEWWSHSCAKVEAGCDMVKLVVARNHYASRFAADDDDVSQEPILMLKKGSILGLAYFRRRIDEDGNDIPEDETLETAMSLIRGIRVAPKFNPEAMERMDLAGNASQYIYDRCIRGIASALLCHVLFTSVRCCNRGVAVVALKNDRAERFYHTHFGAPVCLKGDGRRLYAAMDQQVWGILRWAFARHVYMWMRLGETQQRNTAYQYALPEPQREEGDVLEDAFSIPKQEEEEHQEASYTATRKRPHSHQHPEGTEKHVKAETDASALTNFHDAQSLWMRSYPSLFDSPRLCESDQHHVKVEDNQDSCPQTTLESSRDNRDDDPRRQQREGKENTATPCFRLSLPPISENSVTNRDDEEDACAKRRRTVVVELSKSVDDDDDDEASADEGFMPLYV